MSIVSIFDILQEKIIINDKVTVNGWVRTRRDSKAGISFLTLYDGSCFNSIQVIIPHSLPNYSKDIIHLTTGCSVSVSGKLVLSPSRGQKFEILSNKVKVFGWVKNPSTYPISAKGHSTEYLRKVSHLRARTNLIGSMARIRHTLAQSLHRFFEKNRYLWVSTPIITALDTEGTGKMFRVSTLNLEDLPRNLKGSVDYSKDFFGKESFLTVSGQLNSETYACALSKIYTFGPVFRAENSNTSRHLAEFWMLETEVAFADLEDIIILAKNMLKYVFMEILKECQEDMRFFIKNDNNIIVRLENFISNDIIKIKYTEAITILKKNKNKFKNISWGIDLSSEHERYLTETYFKSPIIVTDYPKTIKAFYMRLKNDNKTVSSMDLLVPGIGEIIGGSQREERIDVLDARMDEIGLNKNDYWWYRDLRFYGSVPHSGFGLGFERLVSYVTGIHNIRDVIPFPRTPNNIEF